MSAARPLPVLWVLLVLGTLVTARCPAQAGQDAELPTPTQVEQRLEAVRALPETAPDRQALVDSWTAVLATVQELAAAKTARSEAVDAANGVPERIESAKAELAALAATPPPELPDAAESSERIASLLPKAQAEAKAAREARARLEAAEQERNARRNEIPTRVQELRARLQELPETYQPSAGAGESEALQEVGAVLLRARRAAARAQIEALEAELASIEARAPLLPLRRELAQARTERLEQFEKELLARRDAARTRESELAAQRAAEEAQRLRQSVNQDLAARAAAAADAVSELVKRSEQLSDEKARIEAVIAELESTFETIREREKTAGLTEAIGLQLRYQKSRLPQVRDVTQQRTQRLEEISRLQLQQVEAEAALRRLDEAAVVAATRQRALERGIPEDRVETEVLAQTRELVASLRKNLIRMVQEIGAAGALGERAGENGNDGNLIDTLSELNTKTRVLARDIESYRNFIDERVLWIRSSPPIWSLSDPLGSMSNALAWMLGSEEEPRLRSVPGALGRVVATHRVTSVVLVLVFLLLLLGRRLARRRLVALGQRAMQKSNTNLLPTIRAALASVFLALPVPFLFVAFGWLLADEAGTTFHRNFGAGLAVAGFSLFTLLLMRVVLLGEGLGGAHFGWHERVRRPLRRAAIPLAAVLMPLEILLVPLARTDEPSWQELPDRVLLTLGGLALSGFFVGVLSPRFGALSIAPTQPGFLWRMRRLWYGAAVLVPLALAGLSLSGYHYSAIQLSQRADLTVLLVATALVVHAFGLRAMLLAKRKLALKQALERAKNKSKPKPTGAAGEAPPPKTESRVDIAAVDAMSRRLIRTLVAVGFLLGLAAVWADMVPALGYLDQVEIGSTAGTETVLDEVTNQYVTRPVRIAVTLVDLIYVLLVLVLTWAAVRNLPGVLELTVLQRLNTGTGERSAILTLARYAITTVGVITAFGVIGISWSNVQWLVAAVSVGLGFGLQEIFANFVSGLILLFERPIRVGDLITVDTVDGYVTRMRIRATTILDFDNRELIVPNKEFVTSRVINWTLTEPITRVVIPVGIAYGSDTEKARAALLQVAKDNPLVLDKPAPSAIFRSFEDSSLLFELRIFLPSRDVWLDLMHTIHTGIDQAFRAAGIEIAFPQRDLHLRSADPLKEMMARAKVDDGTPTAG